MKTRVALKKKHSKNDDDSKYVGTLLGKPNEHGEVQVEGGPFPSIFNWEAQLKLAAERPPNPLEEVSSQTQQGGSQDVDGLNGDRESGGGSRPPSSGLSSLGGRSIADEMDLS